VGPPAGRRRRGRPRHLLRSAVAGEGRASAASSSSSRTSSASATSSVSRATGGVVERMTLRVVVLRDVHGVVHVIPNGEITQVSNMTRSWARVGPRRRRRLQGGRGPRHRGDARWGARCTEDERVAAHRSSSSPRGPRGGVVRGLRGQHPHHGQGAPAQAVGGRPRAAAAAQDPLRPPRGSRSPSPTARSSGERGSSRPPRWRAGDGGEGEAGGGRRGRCSPGDVILRETAPRTKRR
jgi:hypothetical protein